MNKTDLDELQVIVSLVTDVNTYVCEFIKELSTFMYKKHKSQMKSNESKFEKDTREVESMFDHSPEGMNDPENDWHKTNEDDSKFTERINKFLYNTNLNRNIDLKYNEEEDVEYFTIIDKDFKIRDYANFEIEFTDMDSTSPQIHFLSQYLVSVGDLLKSLKIEVMKFMNIKTDTAKKMTDEELDELFSDFLMHIFSI